jgi:DNA-directed RNA polymerase specialized sigma24 family protein
MAKPPVLRNSQSTTLTETEESMLIPDNISVSIRNGTRIVEGYNHDGEKVVIKTTISNNNSSTGKGFRQKEVTVCDELSPEQRRLEAQRLKQEQKLSQAEIARFLGVSQKTISNDLRDDD